MSGSRRVVTVATYAMLGGAVALSARGVWAQAAAAPQAEHKEIAVSEKVLDGYVGRYRLRPELVVTMIRDGDHLYTQANDQSPFELFAETPKDFFAKVNRLRITFVTDDQGKATAVVVHQPGGDVTANRIPDLTADAVKGQCAQIDSMIAAEFAKHPVGSVTAGVVLGKELVWTKSYGDADMEKHVPADQDTIYRIGSITKMFTAVMLEQLVAAGKVHYTDAVDKYFPEIDTVQGRYSWAPPVTFFELATHTSGLGREPDDTKTYVNGAVADWEKTLIAALPHTHYIYEPGTHFSYSNIGYATLGAALSRAAGEPYLEYVPKHIFEPLGMTETSLVLTPKVRAHLSKGYDLLPDKVESETPDRENEQGRGYKVPNGAIYTTVGDLGRFASFLMGDGPDDVLSRMTLDKDLTGSAIQANFQLESGYGIGTFVMRREGYTAFGHGGDVAGYQAALYMNREKGVGVIVLANSIGFKGISTDDLALKALDLLSK